MNISIITPSRNQGEFILETINSVLKQKIGVEYIIMDCLSEDNTLNLLKSYQDKIIFFSELDNGQAHAVNKGIKMAKSEIIGWINSDDIYYDDVFIKVLKIFESDKNLEVIYGKANHIDKGGRIIDEYPTKDWNDKNLLKYCYICQPTVFFRRSVFSKIGYLDESLNYCMDYEFWLRLKDYKINVKQFDFFIAGSRMYEANKTMKNRHEVHVEICDMLKKKYGFVNFKWISNLTDISLSKYGFGNRKDTFRKYNSKYNNKLINNISCQIKFTITSLYQKFQSLYLHIIKKNI
jgi:glycosyltransferase involved in cell wall biosynthesis